jgi:predicted hotdog family 3-hydroxylacyl-ACP dehydratase
MNADEARKVATAQTFKQSKDQLGYIHDLIRDAANNGKFECSLYEELTVDTHDKLETDGFEIERPDKSFSNLHYINWYPEY